MTPRGRDDVSEVTINFSCPFCRIGPEEQVVLTKVSGMRHARVQESQVPERQTHLGYVRHSACEFLRRSEGVTVGSVRLRPPGAQLRAHVVSRRAGSDERSYLLPRHLDELSARQDHARPQDVLS